MTDKKKVAAKKAVVKPSKKKAVEIAKPKPLYKKVSWRGVKDIYKCSQCNHCEDKKDDLVLHIINHYPKNEQVNILDRLTKE